jgi:hypothetical protein
MDNFNNIYININNQKRNLIHYMNLFNNNYTVNKIIKILLFIINNIIENINIYNFYSNLDDEFLIDNMFNIVDINHRINIYLIIYYKYYNEFKYYCESSVSIRQAPFIISYP